jgi:protein required for attachment to host cells
MMSATWILVADGAKARLFEISGKGHSIVEVEDRLNPEGAASGRELSRDRPPSTHDSFGHSRHSIEPHTSLRQKSAEAFARELNDVLEQGRLDHRYGNVVLMAPAHFLGTLNAALNKHVRACVRAELPKDLTQADVRTILAHLPD